MYSKSCKINLQIFSQLIVKPLLNFGYLIIMTDFACMDLRRTSQNCYLQNWRAIEAFIYSPW